MLDLSRRVIVPEIMDQPGLDASEHAQALRGLERINRISATPRILWNPIRCLAKESSRPLRVLDIACGGGDILQQLARRSARDSLRIVYAGCDISPTAVAHAQQNADRNGHTVRFFQHDILDAPLQEHYDVVMCSLFLHHMDEKAACIVLERLKTTSARLVLVHDLVRSPLGYVVAVVGTRLLSRSPIVHNDGPISVKAAFSIAEARDLAARCGMMDARVSWQWPFRFLLEWRRP